MKTELEFSLDINDARVFVDSFDNDVWLSIQVKGGSAYATMSKDKARELIAALTLIVEAD